MKRGDFSLVALGLCAGLCVGGAFFGPLQRPLHAEITSDNFQFTLAWTSDYVYRGVTQSSGDPVFQTGVDFEHSSGFFVGLWASETEIPAFPPAIHPRELELDYYAGYRFTVAPSWTADLSAIFYTYPEADELSDYEYLEYLAGIHYRDRFSLTVGYADEYIGSLWPATSYESTVRFPLPADVDLALGAGYWDLDVAFFDASYAYWSAAVSRSYRRFGLTLTYTDTEDSSEVFFGDAGGSRLIGTVVFQAF